MNLIEKATIVHYHRHRLDMYSSGTVESLGWRGVDSQQKRFEVIARMGDFSSCSLLDVGCGYGGLKRFLDERFENFTYIGIDQMPEFISAAKEQYEGAGNTFFYQSDFTTAEFPQVDYVIASGVLGYRCDVPDFYTGMIQKMYDAADIGFAFNMLDVNVFPDHPLLIGHDSEQITAFCEEISPRIKVITGYLEDDFTVFMYKD